MDRPLIKRIAIYLLSIGWLNWFVVGLVRTLPAGKWRAPAGDGRGCAA